MLSRNDIILALSAMQTMKHVAEENENFNEASKWKLVIEKFEHLLAMMGDGDKVNG